MKRKHKYEVESLGKADQLKRKQELLDLVEGVGEVLDVSSEKYRVEAEAAKIEFKDKMRIGKENKRVLEENKEKGEYSWKIPIEKLYEIDEEFYSWINSMNKGFQHRIGYWRFDEYMRQYRDWMSETDTIEDYGTEEGKIEFVKKRRKRYIENSLYFLNKQWKYMDTTYEGGFAPYTADIAQQIQCFLVDSGYNLLEMKARQIWWTTTNYGILLKRILLQDSYKSKIIISDEKKAVTTFREKLKNPFYEMDKWISTNLVGGDGVKHLMLGSTRGEKRGTASSVEIHPDSETVVNSGTDNFTILDELGLMTTAVELIGNWLPTSFQYDHRVGRMIPKGQMVAYGTSDMSVNPDFEKICRDALNKWKNRDFSEGFLIPIFFNVMARPGFTLEMYESLKKQAYSYEGPGKEKHIQTFHQSFPMYIEDMFLSSAETVIPVTVINRHINRIYGKGDKIRFGYFEPVFDMSRKIEGDYSNDVPYAVIGSTFTDSNGPDDIRTTCVLTEEPDLNWDYRYFKGTDPIMNSSGHSMFGASIWDSLNETISCAMYSRSNNHRYTFLQSVLMMLYYGNNVKDLVESNAGQNYIDFVVKLGFEKHLVYNAELPRILQSSGNIIGINKKGNTATFIKNYLISMIDLHGDKIDIERFWTELKTYVRKPNQTDKDAFKVIDPRYYFDDCIDGVIYGYLCGLCYGHRNPKNNREVSKQDMEVQYEYTYNYRNELVLTPVRNR